MMPSVPQPTSESKMLPGEADTSKWLKATFPEEHNIWLLHSKAQMDLLSGDYTIVRKTRILVPNELVLAVGETIESGEKQSYSQDIRKPPDELHHALFLGGRLRDPQSDAPDFLRGGSLASFLLNACLAKGERDRSVTESSHLYDNLTVEEKIIILDSGFKQGYTGDALEWFIEMFKYHEEKYKPNIHYGRVIAILQSSASGKSRLVKELSTKYPTVSICFRRDTNPTTGWPPGDMAASEFFQSQGETEKYKGEELAAAFLGALFEVIAESIVDSPGGPLAAWDYNPLDKTRSLARAKRLELVKQRAEIALESQYVWLRDKRQWIARAEAAATGTGTTIASGSDNAQYWSTDWHKDLFNTFCAKGFKALDTKIAALKRSHFFLALDECSVLDQVPDPNRLPMSRMSLIAMQRIFKTAESFDAKIKFWFLLLDTNSKAYLLAPSGPKAPSFRLARSQSPLIPFAYLGFNQMAGEVNISTAGESLSVKHLQQFGRPYWSTLPTKGVIRMATEKLFYSGSSASSFNPRNDDHVFAAFASRAALELGHNQASTRLEADAVSHHMRILVSVIGDKLETAAPSEPVLAIASAQALNADPDVYKKSFVRLLDELILKGLVLDRGYQGELCSRLLFILARDRATIEKHGGFLYDEEQRVRELSLAQFLETLLGRYYGLVMLPQDPLPEPSMITELRKFCEQRYINWTHFHVLTHIMDEIPLSLLRWAWNVGAAIQCSHNQPYIDGFIVFYFGALEEPFDDTKLGYVAWQTKAKNSAAAYKLGDALTGPPIIMDRGNGRKRVKDQSVILLMDLATDSPFVTGSWTQVSLRKAKTPYEDKPNMTPDQKSKVWKGYCVPDNGEQEPKNFLINIRGRDVAQYPVIKKFEKEFDGLFLHSLSEILPPEIVHIKTQMERKMNRFEYE